MGLEHVDFTIQYQHGSMVVMLMMRLCGGVECSGISVMIINVSYNSTFTALNQGMAAVNTTVGTHGTGLPALVGI